jgi:hypothetical protein
VGGSSSRDKGVAATAVAAVEAAAAVGVPLPSVGPELPSDELPLPK